MPPEQYLSARLGRASDMSLCGSRPTCAGCARSSRPCAASRWSLWPARTLGEGYAERAYRSADGTRVCTYSDSRTARKIVYDVPSGRATIGGASSFYDDRERSCRSVADAASIETCDLPTGNDAFGEERLFRGSGAHLSQRWVAPNVKSSRQFPLVHHSRGAWLEGVRLLPVDTR